MLYISLIMVFYLSALLIISSQQLILVISDPRLIPNDVVPAKANVIFDTNARRSKNGGDLGKFCAHHSKLITSILDIACWCSQILESNGKTDVLVKCKPENNLMSMNAVLIKLYSLKVRKSKHMKRLNRLYIAFQVPVKFKLAKFTIRCPSGSSTYENRYIYGTGTDLVSINIGASRDGREFEWLAPEGKNFDMGKAVCNKIGVPTGRVRRIRGHRVAKRSSEDEADEIPDSDYNNPRYNRTEVDPDEDQKNIDEKLRSSHNHERSIDRKRGLSNQTKSKAKKKDKLIKKFKPTRLARSILFSLPLVDHPYALPIEEEIKDGNSSSSVPKKNRSGSGGHPKSSTINAIRVIQPSGTHDHMSSEPDKELSPDEKFRVWNSKFDRQQNFVARYVPKLEQTDPPFKIITRIPYLSEKKNGFKSVSKGDFKPPRVAMDYVIEDASKNDVVVSKVGGRNKLLDQIPLESALGKFKVNIKWIKSNKTMAAAKEDKPRILLITIKDTIDKTHSLFLITGMVLLCILLAIREKYLWLMLRSLLYRRDR